MHTLNQNGSLVLISFLDAHSVRLPYFAPIIFLELPPFP